MSQPGLCLLSIGEASRCLLGTCRSKHGRDVSTGLVAICAPHQQMLQALMPACTCMCLFQHMCVCVRVCVCQQSHDALFAAELKKYEPIGADIQRNSEAQAQLLATIDAHNRAFRQAFDINSWRNACNTAAAGTRAEVSGRSVCALLPCSHALTSSCCLVVVVIWSSGLGWK